MKLKTKKNICRKAACLILTSAMCATFIAGQFAALASPAGSTASTEKSEQTAVNGANGANGYSLGFQNATGKVDLSGIKLNNLSEKVIVNESVTTKERHTVIVELNSASVCNGGDIAAIEAQQTSFLSELSSKGIDYEYKCGYTNVLNGVAVTVPLSSISEIKSIKGVSSLSLSTTYARPTEVEDDGYGQLNDSNIYPNGIYDSSEYTAKGMDGRGMSVAILDTGLDYTHPAFDEENMAYPDEGYSLDDIREIFENNNMEAEIRSGSTADDVFISKKVPFAYDYSDYEPDVYPSYSQHGTHVAGIVAGKTKPDEHYTDKDGKPTNNRFLGVAPEAQLVICKVFTDNLDSEDIGGARSEDIIAALDDCVALNVDVINMSLGTTAGFSSEALRLCEEEGVDTEGKNLNRVYENIRKKGISLMVAASNDYSAGFGSQFGTNLATNPDSGTVGSPSTFDGAMSVASINGQYSPYILVNEEKNGATVSNAIYYEESRNEDSDAYNFLDDMLGKVGEEGAVNQATFRYVVIPGYGSATDYTPSIKKALETKDGEEKVIAVVKRGGNGLTFKKKIQAAKNAGAEAIIVYNNVSGMIRMSLEDLDDRIPAISVSIDAGEYLTGAGSNRKSGGTITLNRDFVAGPFMNDYSSWGVTPDLKLKPDVTSHGGEIISTVAGGYEEMSGTSMACPNLAGFTALLRGWLRDERASLWGGSNDDEGAVKLTNLTNNIMMSTAVTVYDQNKLPYSPRKQGSGLATMKNVFNTKAYLSTDDPESGRKDGRPKAELGEDEKKNGVYDITFYVNNIGSTDLTFKTKSIFMTETLSKDGMSVAEKAYLLKDEPASWKVNGTAVEEGANITAAAEDITKIEVTLKLSEKEKQYLNKTFKNGMFVEGFLQLESVDTNAQCCDLTFPFMGFYGDWEAAPLLDYDCFDIAKFDKDTSLTYETRPKASVWATQAYSYYWNNKYSTPMGNFLYLQDPAKEHTAEYVYTEEEHVSLSRFNEFYGEAATNNYCTVNGIRGLYAGLLRNAEIVTYTLTNVDTGEQIPDENGKLVREVYRARKAHSSGGNAVPSQVETDMMTEDMNFDGNGKYRFDFNFYFKYADYKAGKTTKDTFSMSFYVDYEAPVLVDSRIRYQDVKVDGKETQKVYLDLDIFDNHYPQAVLLCYSEEHVDDVTQIDENGLTTRLATEYITPVLNPKKNTTNTVSIDVTEFYEEYKDRLIVEIDDYAMNHNVYLIDTLKYAQGAVITDGWSVKDTLSLDKNTATKVTIKDIGKANASNFTWSSSDEDIVMVKNGEVFGKEAGTATVTVTGPKPSASGSTIQTIEVTVKPSSKTLKTPSISFGTMLNEFLNPVKAEGSVNVNPGQKISLSVVADPWYYPIETLDLTWESDNQSLATVDQNGNVTLLYEGDDVKSVSITASSKKYTSCKASVSLAIQDPYTVSNGTLTHYDGLGGVLVENYKLAGQPLDKPVRVLKIPSDKSIISIGEEAFKDVENVEVVIIPKMVASIGQRAFKGCKNLKKICFVNDGELLTDDKYLNDENLVDKDKIGVKSSLNMIYRNAFEGCDNLTTVDLSNCKVITLDIDAFAGCTGLKEVISMNAIGTAYDRAFKDCTSLESADITDLHLAGREVFKGCTSLRSIKTGEYTALGGNMFDGCEKLKYDAATEAEGIVINCKVVPYMAFNGCTDLTKVTFTAQNVNIGDRAFYECTNLATADVQNGASYVGAMAFGCCFSLRNNIENLKSQIAGAEMGYNVFQMIGNVGGENGYIQNGKLIFAAQEITDDKTLVGSVEKIASYAFSKSSLKGISTIDLTGITEIGEGAFYRLKGLTSIVIPNGIKEIPDYAFAETDLTAVEIPASVTRIGAHAFEGCKSLQSLTFAEGSTLTTIDAYAFSGTAINGALDNLPNTVNTIGDAAFARCNQITAVTLPSVKKMGEGVFMACTNLATAVFGDETTVTGTYTFYAFDESTMKSVQSSLTTVTLGNGITKIDKGTFTYCDALTQIDLKNVTEVGAEAFAGCSKLATVTGIEEVVSFGNYAFTETALSTLNLAAAKQIGMSAFIYCGNLESVTFGSSLLRIEDEAFAGSKLRTVKIPASCSYIGTSAFSGKATINGIVRPIFNGYEIEAGNENYFAEDGVLYQYIHDDDEEKDTYSLIAYPDARAAEKVEGVATYRIKEGTISVGKFAFGSIIKDKVEKVIFPYTVKTIGHGAFFGSGISTFEFESINAPVLLEDLTVMNGVVTRPIQGDYSTNSFFYMNFFGYMSDTVPHYPGDGKYEDVVNELTIRYPSNGKGYDNLIYSHYFGTKTVLAEMIEDDTRALISLIQKMFDAQTVSSWNKTNTDTEEVEAFAAIVKQANVYKKGLTATQTTFVDEALLTKLSEVSAALKPVKKAFGIPVKISTCAIVTDSQYKTAYYDGETFDMSGIKVRVSYDDDTEEIINASGNFTLATGYDKPLSLNDNMVELVGVGEYAGATLSVRGLTVTEGTGAHGGLPVWAIILIAVGGAAILAAVAAVVTIILVKKSKAKSLNSATEEGAVQETAEDNAAEETAEEDTSAQEPAEDNAAQETVEDGATEELAAEEPATEETAEEEPENNTATEETDEGKSDD